MTDQPNEEMAELRSRLFDRKTTDQSDNAPAKAGNYAPREGHSPPIHRDDEGERQFVRDLFGTSTT